MLFSLNCRRRGAPALLFRASAAPLPPDVGHGGCPVFTSMPPGSGAARLEANLGIRGGRVGGGTLCALIWLRPGGSGGKPMQRSWGTWAGSVAFPMPKQELGATARRAWCPRLRRIWQVIHGSYCRGAPGPGHSRRPSPPRSPGCCLRMAELLVSAQQGRRTAFVKFKALGTGPDTEEGLSKQTFPMLGLQPHGAAPRCRTRAPASRVG